MTIDEFNAMIMEMAMARMGLERYCGFLRHDTREDKYLREEYLAIQAVARFKGYPGDATIELGDEREKWDARIAGRHLFEVVQAIPANEHVIRKSVAGRDVCIMAPVLDPDPGEPTEMPITGGLARLLIQAEHAYDHFQFPRVIVEAIEKKHRKKYPESRTLIVVFDGDYSFEDDSIIHGWVDEVRQQSRLGVFKEILLLELARQRTFPVF